VTRAIVIGAGIMGLSIAYNLAARGVNVVVLEKKYPGSGLSGRAIGGIHSQWDNEDDIRFAMRSRDILSRLSGELNFNIPFRRNGYLMLATQEDELTRLTKIAELHNSLGGDTTILSSEEIVARYPMLEPSSILGGTLSMGDGVVHPFSLVFGYWTALEEHGGKLLRSTAAKGLQAEEGHVYAVETDVGMQQGDIFVVSAGAGTREILRSVDHDVPTKLVKHEMFATEPLKFFLKPMIQVNPKGMCLNQSLRGEVICDIPRTGEMVHEDTKSTLKFLEEAASELTRLLPQLGEVKVLRPWAGLIETTGDSRPICGRLGYDNLWVAFADSGKGIMFSPAIGEIMSEAILTHETSPDLVPYSPSRLLG
jgi:sarcosine oxidase subunit beta